MTAVVDVDDALETLVRQFSDPLACLRELVQNALDAGSRQIDIDICLQDGVMTLEVQDQGQGMDRQIIDTKLTRLFASSKDGDFTKIGRFGIGFVSVFALEPDAVCVDTGRGGERWRVLFRKDRTFARIALEEPVAGTRVRIIKAVSPEEYEALSTRALDVLRYWCKHVDGEIYFKGALVSGPLALEDTPIQVRHVEEGTEVLVGIAQDFRTFGGFYNKGLTLFEGTEGALPGLVFKVSSRYLEHTLTRDNVLHDDNFQKAMDIVHRLAGGPLVEALVARLGTDAHAWQALGARLRHNALPAAFFDRPLFPAEGGPLSIKALRRHVAKGRLFFARESNPLTRACHRDGAQVLWVGAHGPAIGAAVTLACGQEPLDLERHFVLPDPADATEEAAFAALRGPLLALLPEAKVAALVPGHVPNVPEAVAVAVAKLDEPTPMAEIGRLESGLLARKRTLVVNLDHPAVAALLPSAAREPELCAWMLARLFLLWRAEAGRGADDGLDPAREAALLTLAVAGRQARIAR